MKRIGRLLWAQTRDFISYLLRVGPEVGKSIAACWWIFAVYLGGLGLLTFVAQGRDAVLATLDSASYPFFWLFATTVLASVQAQAIAGRILETRALAQGESIVSDSPIAFAAHFVPFLFPLLLLLVWPEVLKKTVLTDAGDNQFFVGLLLGFALGIPAAAIYSALNKDTGTGTAMLLGLAAPGVLATLTPVPGPIIIAAAIIGIAAVIRSVLARGAMPQVRWSAVLMIFGGVYGLAAIWALAHVSADRTVGAAGTVMLILQAYVLVLAALQLLVNRLMPKRPHLAFSAVIALICILLTCGRVQDRPVRELSGSKDLLGPQLTLDDYAKQWLSERRAEIDTGEYPVIVVMAEGGGIRAAYWTASVLGAIQDASPAFSHHVIGYSGVSGGSVGVATFASIISETKLPTSLCSTVEACGQLVLTDDFLAPALGTMFTWDVLSSLSLQKVSFEDRGVALERAFENRWKAIMGTDRFAQRFTDRSLFLNSTSDMTGKKVVINPFLFPTPLRLSTAMILSARFPIVSPGGMINKDRLVDGGYFDNSGAATASELLRAVMREADALKLSGHLKLLAISIGNDTQAPSMVCEGSNSGPYSSLPVVGAIATLDHVRAAHAQQVRKELEESLPPGHFLSDFSLYTCAGEHEIPLGRTLSDLSRRVMTVRLQEIKGRLHHGLKEIVAILDK